MLVFHCGARHELELSLKSPSSIHADQPALLLSVLGCEPVLSTAFSVCSHLDQIVLGLIFGEKKKNILIPNNLSCNFLPSPYSMGMELLFASTWDPLWERIAECVGPHVLSAHAKVVSEALLDTRGASRQETLA